ncbi:alpha/beta fold hydrolase [Methylobacterium platani]|uniref:Hydrolase n=2 Tax=Methylobacterium platani TaxID=427683 RepID=A0A179SAH9_9HYPH|nr:alpha/beta hydrolase [Methylobacterium platani]KMO21912.1 hydrolase [Methylobacterium platani JCM 14648]OAS24764.1 hydrolase [Methylobacterium platani]
METQTLSLVLAGRSLTLPADRIGEGAPALLLPALSSISTREEMRPLAMRLSARHRCLVPDWPGFGAQPRARVPLAPDMLHAFLDALVAREPGPYALGVAAGHAAGYLVAAAARHPGAFARLVLVAPTWRGPLPTAMGEERRPLFGRLRRAVEAPGIGTLLYRLNVSTPVVSRMMRAHVYADPARVTPALLADKQRVTHQPRARFGTAAFVTGGLDPVRTREAFHALFGPGLPPVTVLRPKGAPRRSGAEMTALAETGRVRSVEIPGALAAHEEYPEAVAAAILAAEV